MPPVNYIVFVISYSLINSDYFFGFLFDLRLFPFFARAPFLIGLNLTDFLIFLSCCDLRCSVSLEDFFVVFVLLIASECFLFFPGFVVVSLDFVLLQTFGKSSAIEKSTNEKIKSVAV